MALDSHKTLIILVIIVVCKVGVCASNRAELRKIALQFKHMKKAINADIDDLRNEVIELNYQLEIERARADNLEAFVNASDASLADGDSLAGAGNSIQNKALNDRVKEQEKEIKLLKQEVESLKLNGDGDVRKPMSIMRKAFMEEKNALKKLRHQLTNENEVRKTESIKQIVMDVLDETLRQELTELNQSCEIVQKEIATLDADVQDMKVNLSMMQLGIDLNEKGIEELQKCCEDKKVVVTFEKEQVAVRPALTSQTNYTGSRDYTVYALFDEDMAKNIRIGSRVIRGKDWSWGNQDGHGPGTVVSWYNNNNASQQVDVKWDVGRKVNYRIGAHNRYDLYIITGGVDGHIASTRRFKPIFGKDLEAAISIGSRVIRGEDWSWGQQDNGGTGTVVSWYAGNKATQQVMVDWDLGRKANYRVGALGKYDLFILADGQ